MKLAESEFKDFTLLFARYTVSNKFVSLLPSSIPIPTMIPAQIRPRQHIPLLSQQGELESENTLVTSSGTKSESTSSPDPDSLNNLKKGLKNRKKTSLKKHHLKIDEYKHKFECQICAAKFKRNEHMQRHMRIHTGARPFSCDICCKKFSRADNRDTHMLVHREKQRQIEIFPSQAAATAQN